MMSRRTGVRRTAFGGVLLAVLALGQSGVSAQSLEEALAKAYLNNPTLRAARAELRATDEGVAQAQSGWRPTLELGYDIGKEYSDSSGGSNWSAGSQNRTPRSGSVTLEQNIFQGFRTVAGTERAEEIVKAERARLASTEQQVLLDAATAYMDVVRDEAVLNLNVNNERVLKRQLEATRDRFEVGEVTRTDVAQAESRLSSAIADRIQAEGALVRSRASRSDGASVTAQLTVPLYQAGAVSSRIRQAKQTWSQQRLLLEAAVRDATQAATDAWKRLETARAQIAAFTAAVRAGEIALEGVRQEAQVGSRTVLDVLDAEQELLNARVSLVRAERDAVVASVDLRQAVGTLLASDLNLPVEKYDPEKNYRAVRDRWFGTGITGE